MSIRRRHYQFQRHGSLPKKTIAITSHVLGAVPQFLQQSTKTLSSPTVVREKMLRTDTNINVHEPHSFTHGIVNITISHNARIRLYRPFVTFDCDEVPVFPHLVHLLFALL